MRRQSLTDWTGRDWEAGAWHRQHGLQASGWLHAACATTPRQNFRPLTSALLCAGFVETACSGVKAGSKGLQNCSNNTQQRFRIPTHTAVAHLGPGACDEGEEEKEAAQGARAQRWQPHMFWQRGLLCGGQCTWRCELKLRVFVREHSPKPSSSSSSFSSSSFFIGSCSVRHSAR